MKFLFGFDSRSYGGNQLTWTSPAGGIVYTLTRARPSESREISKGCVPLPKLQISVHGDGGGVHVRFRARFGSAELLPRN